MMEPAREHLAVVGQDLLWRPIGGQGVAQSVADCPGQRSRVHLPGVVDKATSARAVATGGFSRFTAPSIGIRPAPRSCLGLTPESKSLRSAPCRPLGASGQIRAPFPRPIIQARRPTAIANAP